MAKKSFDSFGMVPVSQPNNAGIHIYEVYLDEYNELFDSLMSERDKLIEQCLIEVLKQIVGKEPSIDDRNLIRLSQPIFDTNLNKANHMHTVFFGSLNIGMITVNYSKTSQSAVIFTPHEDFIK